MTEPYDAIKDIGHCPECGATGDYAELLKQRDDLLAALKEADEDFKREGFGEESPYRKPILAAIAKAEASKP